MSKSFKSPGTGFIAALNRRGVLRVAASYAVIAWLLLQIADVVLDPFAMGDSAMRVLLVVVALGFPVALVLAWFYELTPQGVELDRQGPEETRPVVGGVRRYADVLIIGGLVILVAFLLAERGGLIEEAPGQPVVAVLPFTNLSPEAEDAYFGEGLADTLIHKLGQLNELVVLASQSTFQFREQGVDLIDVGDKLGATVLLLGSVQRGGESLRINARLVEVDTGRQLWAGSYDRAVVDVFQIQDEIATAATQALQLVLAPASKDRMTSSQTSNLTAYESYVLGTRRLAARNSADRGRAIGYFREAIQADPGYALAYTGLVEALYLQAHAAPDPVLVKPLHQEASEAASTAARLEPELGEAWLARAMTAVIDRDMLGGAALSDPDIIALFERAIELSPSNAMALKYLANFYSNSLKQPSENHRHLLVKASELDPRSGIILINIGNSYEGQGDFAAAETWYRRALTTREPYFVVAPFILVGLHLVDTGQLDEAARWARAWGRQDPENFRARVGLQTAYLELDALERAEEALLEMLSHPLFSENGGSRAWRRESLNQALSLMRRTGKWDEVQRYWSQYVGEFLQSDSDWPVLQQNSGQGSAMTASVLADANVSDFSSALERLEAAYPGPFESADWSSHELMHPAVLLGPVYRQAGFAERGEAYLRRLLDYFRMAEEPQCCRRHPWTDFAVLAFLGETEAALAELEQQVEGGIVAGWWALTEGAFDPNYAAVMAEPRFEAAYARILTIVADQRAGFLAQPELSDNPFPYAARVRADAGP